jgi:hypothetical protein
LFNADKRTKAHWVAQYSWWDGKLEADGSEREIGGSEE